MKFAPYLLIGCIFFVFFLGFSVFAYDDVIDTPGLERDTTGAIDNSVLKYNSSSGLWEVGIDNSGGGSGTGHWVRDGTMLYTNVSGDDIQVNGTVTAITFSGGGLDADNLADNDTDDLSEGASNFWATLARIQSLCSNDFHNIGGVDATGTDDLDDLSDNNTDQLSEGASNFWTTLARIQSLCSNDFHNIGGTDDDIPDSGDLGIIDTEAEFESELFAILTPGESGSNIFDQDLNTTDSPTFDDITLTSYPNLDKDSTDDGDGYAGALGHPHNQNLNTTNNVVFYNMTLTGDMMLIGNSTVNATGNLTIGNPGDIILGDDTERNMYPNTTLKMNLGMPTNYFNNGYFNKLYCTGVVDPPCVLFDLIFFNDLVELIDKQIEPEKQSGMVLYYDGNRMCAYNPSTMQHEELIWKSEYDKLEARIENLEKIIYGLL